MRPKGERMAIDLKQELDDYPMELPTRWEPKPGDTLIGHIAWYDCVPCPEGTVCVVVIETGPGSLTAVWLTSHVLRHEFDKKRPPVGATVGIKRLADVVVNWEVGARYALRVETADI